MKSILEQLYNGDLDPATIFRPQLEKYWEVQKRNFRNYEAFTQKLGSTLGKEFQQIMDEQFDTCPYEATSAFVEGFRMGARMIIEVYGGGEWEQD